MPLHNNKVPPMKAVCLAALLLTSATLSQAQSPVPATPAAPTLDIQRYLVEGDNPLSEDESRAVLAPFVGSNRNLNDIETAAAALERAMRDRGFAFHRMFVPVQKPVDGVIRLQVIGIKLGKVEVLGNERFTTDNIRRSLTNLQEGQIPEVRTLGRDVTASNANPAKQLSVTFRESAVPGQVDAQVRVKDSPTLVVFAGLTANQGLSDHAPAQNVYRLTGGIQHANLFDRDHVATVSYTTDPGNPSNVSLFGMFYQVPFYGTGLTLSAYYTTSDINSGQVQQGAGVFDVSGSGRFAGVRLTRALERIDALQQTIGLSFDSRLFENKTTFNGALIQPDVGSRVATLQYSFRNEPAWGELSGGIDYAVNTGGGPGNSAAEHAANGGVRNWAAWRFHLDASAEVSGWQITGRLRGQVADKPLIPGEQLGLGGANSVRGFADRVVAGDFGHHLTVEALGPAIGDMQLRPLLFVDRGQVHARSTGAGEVLASAGIGLRFSHKNLQVALDAAQVIDGERARGSVRPLRLHLGMTYRF
jgi:hemolysin activation/secretion protein